MRISTLAPIIESVIGDSTCGDLGFYGKKFTWFKKYPSSGIWERLDRAVSTTDWVERFSCNKGSILGLWVV